MSWGGGYIDTYVDVSFSLVQVMTLTFIANLTYLFVHVPVHTTNTVFKLLAKLSLRIQTLHINVGTLNGRIA